MFQKVVILFLVLSVSALADTDVIQPRLNPHIVGGHEVDIKDYPFIVSIRLLNMHICGGSIYSSKIILTAAHCITTNVTCYMKVYAGSSTLSEDLYKRNILATYAHPKYKPLEEYDIGIIILSEALEFNDHVQPIPLQGIRQPEDSLVTVPGWGYEQEQDENNSNHLKATELKIVSNEDCAKAYEVIPGASITSSVICAYNDRTDACQNDSGGPLIFEGHLLAIVSYGLGCGRPGFPGIYTSIPDLHDWIIENAKKPNENTEYC